MDSSQPPPRPGEVRVLLVACLAALAIRLVYIFTLEPKILWFDGEEYSRLAKGMLDGLGYTDIKGNPSAAWPPGYPVFLAGVYAVLGRSVTAVRIVQSVLGAGAVLVVHRLGLRIVGRRAALFAACVVAVYPLYVYSAGAFFPVTLQTVQLAGTILLLLMAAQRRSWAHAAAAGLLAGWTSLTAASALPPMVLLAFWLAWVSGRPSPHLRAGADVSVGARANRPPGGARAGAGWARGRLVLAYLLPIALLVGAWTSRNAGVFGRPVFVSTNGGYNLWLGNYPGVTASTGNRMDLRGMQEEHDRIISDWPGESVLDVRFRKRALEHIRDDPGRFVRLSLSKAAAFWALYPQPMTEDRPRVPGEKLISILSYGVLLPFALFRLLRSLRRDRVAPMVLALCLVYTALHAVILSKVRYRLPLDVFVILYGAGGMLALWDWARLYRQRNLHP